MNTSGKILAGLVLLNAAAGAAADAPPQPAYDVTITNISKSSQFTPILAATHRSALHFFTLGEPASEGLALMAEGGDTSVLESEVTATGGVIDTANSADVLGMPPLLFAGDSVTLTLSGRPSQSRFSMAAMILPTNDNFVALDNVALPRFGSRIYYALGYDAGSEMNDELCISIPGPTCGGEGFSEAGGEGFVHVASGIHGIGDLPAETYDWRNPIARVVIRRVR